MNYQCGLSRCKPQLGRIFQDFRGNVVCLANGLLVSSRQHLQILFSLEILEYDEVVCSSQNAPDSAVETSKQDF